MILGLSLASTILVMLLVILFEFDWEGDDYEESL